MWKTCMTLVQGVILWHNVGVFCQKCPSRTVLEGGSVTIDCGFQTTVDGGNLIWMEVSNGSETPIGHIVPGDHFCGIESINCTLHTNGSITLFNVTVGDGNKYYSCLRGDEEGYHYFANSGITVLIKESMGHPVIQPSTGSKAHVFMIGKKGMIYSYDQPTCEDKEDGALRVTCYPPSGVIVDKERDHVHCNCTDSDGNSDSLNIAVNRTSGHPVINKITGSIAASYSIGGKDVIHSYEQPTCKDDEDGDLIVTCHPPSGVIVDKVYDQVHCNCTDSDGNSASLNITVDSHTKLTEMLVAAILMSGCALCLTVLVILLVCKHNAKQSKTEQDAEEELSNLDEEFSDLKQMLDEKKIECTKMSVEIDKCREISLKKDTDISDLRQRLSEKEAECTEKSEKINKLEEMNQRKDMDIHRLIQRLTAEVTGYAGNMPHNMSRLNTEKSVC